MLQESDGEKSDTDLVVDVGKEGVSIFTRCSVYVHYSLVVLSAGMNFSCLGWQRRGKYFHS